MRGVPFLCDYHGFRPRRGNVATFLGFRSRRLGVIADTVTVGHEARQGDTAMSDHIRRKVWAELKRRYAQEHAPVDATIEHLDGRVEIVRFDGKQYHHELGNYRWTAEEIGGRA